MYMITIEKLEAYTLKGKFTDALCTSYAVYLRNSGYVQNIALATVTKKHSHAYEIKLTTAGQIAGNFSKIEFTAETLSDAKDLIQIGFYNEEYLERAWNMYT